MRRDAQLASPLILDLAVITKLMQRIEALPVVNALNRQKRCIENLFRALVRLLVEISMLLQCKLRDM